MTNAFVRGAGEHGTMSVWVEEERGTEKREKREEKKRHVQFFSFSINLAKREKKNIVSFSCRPSSKQANGWKVQETSSPRRRLSWGSSSDDGGTGRSGRSHADQCRRNVAIDISRRRRRRDDDNGQRCSHDHREQAPAQARRRRRRHSRWNSYSKRFCCCWRRGGGSSCCKAQEEAPSFERRR